MKTVNIHEAKTTLSALLSDVQNANEHVVICRAGEPIAEIIPYQRKKRSSIKKGLKPTTSSFDLTQPISEDWSIE
ncbi:MAG: type II toxin-antitoxin system Phd/YefM family antitoxin [Planctomycetes bacterium]|nr:type II toxin-antitoxin system Phd/YefM family antitoxin [Planctomycetota bacterium]